MVRLIPNIAFRERNLVGRVNVAYLTDLVEDCTWLS